MIHLLILIIYLAFISLGLPDSLLGAAWPSMYGELNVPISYAGVLSMIIALGTIISSLFSDALTKRIGTGRVTAISVAMTAIALLAFSMSNSFWMLCLWAIPYGLGAGSVDAALNNFVALHYASRHMSWLHCMWGVGTIIGPSIMGYVLTHGQSWHVGYQYISLMQIVLTVALFVSLPLWKKKAAENQSMEESDTKETESLSLPKILHIPGAKEVMLTFFCYCAMESTASLWASSYMVLHNGVSAEDAAGYASIFFVGITVGRLLSGFLTFKFTDTQMIRIGQSMVILGGIILLLPLGATVSLIGIVIIGFGCAPIYPCIIHSTPAHFGADKSQAMIGVQMASAYVGTCLMPPLFGLIANHISVALLPVYVLILAVIMIVVHERLLKLTA